MPGVEQAASGRRRPNLTVLYEHVANIFSGDNLLRLPVRKCKDTVLAGDPKLFAHLNDLVYRAAFDNVRSGLGFRGRTVKTEESLSCGPDPKFVHGSQNVRDRFIWKNHGPIRRA